MRLRELQMSGFGKLHAYTIPLGDDITVLHGANEAGKSTVLHCIAQVLMGKPSQRSLFPDFTPWDGGEFAAALEIEDNGHRYRLLRRFAEGGARAVSLSQLRADGSERLLTREAGEVRNWVAAALGTGDDRIFYRVFCLTQADLHPLDNYHGLREHLEKVASGTEVAVAAAVQRIEARLATLRRGVGQPALRQNWGSLKRAEEARREWEARLHEARRQQKRLAEVRDRNALLQAKINETTTRLAEIAGVLEQDHQRKEIQQRLNLLRASWKGMASEQQRLQELQAELERLQRKCDALPPPFADLPALHMQLLRAEQARASALWMWGTLFGFVAGLTGGLVIHRPLIVIAVMLLGVPLLIWLLTRALQPARLCRTLAVSSLAEARQRLQDAEDGGRALDATMLALETMTGGYEPDRQQEMALQVAALTEQLARISGEPLSAEAAYRLEREAESLRAQLPTWQEEERALARELAVIEASEQAVIDIEDGVAYWQQEEARSREEEKMLLLARQLLLTAGAQTHQSIADPLAAHMSPLFAAMTGGRYPRVQVTGDANTLSLLPRDVTGAAVPPEQLSRGTRDQFLLAARLALGLVIAGPTGTPLFLLDDPLLHFDAARRREALAMLTELAAQHQIIIATHDETILADLPTAHLVSLA